MIDTHLLDTYIAELEALRTHGRDLAQAHPDLAGRLDIGSRRSRDPHVERVVESTAFLAARLRLMMEMNATELPLAALSLLAPALVEPVPSMVLLQLSGGSEPQVVPRGTRFDYEIGGQVLACFSTSMDTTVSPMTLQLRRFEPTSGSQDGIGIRITGVPTERLLFQMGNDPVSAAELLDALGEDLVSIQVVLPDGGFFDIPNQSLQIHGFGPEEALLPVRNAAHQAHRLVTEFMVFPEKFRFVSITGLPLESGSEIRFRFSRRLLLPHVLPPDLITVNRIPAVNIWPTAATPFDITGRQMEYPVRADALRYRTVECHSVEGVEIYGPDGGAPFRIDPVLTLGELHGTSIRWGVRRTVSRMGSEVLMYFQGLDYTELGHQRMLAAPAVLASNRDVAERTPANAWLHPVEGMGNWHCNLASIPTPYRPALTGAEAMEMLIAYLQSSLQNLAGSVVLLREYLAQFHGASDANWIDAITSVTAHPVATMRDGFPHRGLALSITFERNRYRTTSLAVVKRVLGLLFESQRGLNQVQHVVVRSG